MCTAGTCGLAMCATRLMPVAKKSGSSSAPGICFANSGEKRPPTVETLTPTFSNTVPVICPRTPPPPGVPSSSIRSQGINSKLASLPASRSIASNSSQMRVRSKFEPVASGLLLVVERFHAGSPWVCRSASPRASAADVARLNERTCAPDRDPQRSVARARRLRPGHRRFPCRTSEYRPAGMQSHRQSIGLGGEQDQAARVRPGEMRRTRHGASHRHDRYSPSPCAALACRPMQSPSARSGRSARRNRRRGASPRRHCRRFRAGKGIAACARR